MTVKEAIEIYKTSKTLPRKCHLNWLKENFNPILYDIDKSLNINWACQTCSNNYLKMIARYLDELEQLEQLEEQQQKKKDAKKLPRKRKKANKS